MSFLQGGPSLRGSAGWALLLYLFLGALGALACGCGPKSYPAPVMEPPVSAADQATAKQIASQFTGDLKAKNASAARQLMAPSLDAQPSASVLAAKLKSGSLSMIPTSRNWQFLSVQSLRRGKQLLVHSRFTTPDNSLYYTNVEVVKNGNNWLVDLITDPVKKALPVKGKITRPGRSSTGSSH